MWSFNPAGECFIFQPSSDDAWNRLSEKQKLDAGKIKAIALTLTKATERAQAQNPNSNASQAVVDRFDKAAFKKNSMAASFDTVYKKLQDAKIIPKGNKRKRQKRG